MQDTDHYIQENLARYLGEFAELIAIPSISTDPAFAARVAEAAEWVMRRMTDAASRRTPWRSGGRRPSSSPVRETIWWRGGRRTTRPR